MIQGKKVVINGGVVVPMVRDREWYKGHVAVENGTISDLGKDHRADSSADELQLDAKNCLVLPGFVQGHVHVVQSLLRHQADGLELLDWLRNRTWPYEAALSGDEVEVAAELGIAELLAGGTTTALDLGTTHDHDRIFTAAARMGIRMVSGKTHMDIGDGVPKGLLEDCEQSLSDAAELGDRWHGAEGGRLRYAVAPRFALSCSRRLLEGCVELARERGWMLHSHASENQDEVAIVRELTGLANIEYLDQVGLTGQDVVLAHGVHLSEDEIQLLARTGTRICHCPGANLKLASGIADIPRLIDAGVPLALGADGPPCNNRLSVFHEMSLAGSLHNVRHGPKAVDPWTVLALATRDGAQALHLGDRVGTLEIGKAADVVVVDVSSWSCLPGGDPASLIVYGASAAHVRHVLVDGRVVVHNGSLVDELDPEGIRDRCREAWPAVAARMKELS